MALHCTLLMLPAAHARLHCALLLLPALMLLANHADDTVRWCCCRLPMQACPTRHCCSRLPIGMPPLRAAAAAGCPCFLALAKLFMCKHMYVRQCRVRMALCVFCVKDAWLLLCLQVVT